MLNLDFLNILSLITLFSGVVILVDYIIRKKSSERSSSTSLIVEYARSFFPVLLLVVLIRAFLAQPYRVPTGSLEPTVLPGDFIFVTQFDYGLRVPLIGQSIYDVGKPVAGQIALFHWPVNPQVTFVKRVIGVPGDHISYINKVLYINGKKQPQVYEGPTQELLDNSGQTATVDKYRETLNGVTHEILINPQRKARNFTDLVVPPNSYFMMGDNRDNSDDSRDWGFVPQHQLIGRARYIWLSIGHSLFDVRWHRIGNKL